MLIRFGVQNYLSIRDRAEISLVASVLRDEAADLIDGPGTVEKLLPAAVIYGANASGKTNLMSGIAAMRSAVVYSQTRTSPTAELRYTPFRLDRGSPTAPSRFDCDFAIEGVRYHYGFSHTRTVFEEEWLYAFPEGKRQTWFIRNHKSMRFGKNLRGKNRAIEAFMRDNSLFLSAAAQNAHPLLLPIYEFFEKQVDVTISPDVDPGQLQVLLAQQGLDPRIIEFLHSADTGISSWTVEKAEMSEQTRKIVKGVFALLVEQFPESARDFPQTEEPMTHLKLGHRTAEGDDVFFDLLFESRGTLRLLSLLQMAMRSLQVGGVLAVDELDASLHTLLAKTIVGLFNSRRTNKKGAQLISTTHDTNLLRTDSLRRDQIWFAEKDSGGVTHFYPLTDIRTRNSDNLEKGYLQGRFGAVPFIGSAQRLLDPVV